MKISFFTFVILLGSSSRLWAAPPAPFDLETWGDRVCKVGDAYPQPVCFTKAGSGQASLIKIPEVFDLVPQVEAFAKYGPVGEPLKVDSIRQLEEIGGALFISPGDRATIKEYYRELSIRNLGFDLEHIVTGRSGTRIPFVASVRWKGAVETEGTLQVEGYILLPSEVDLGRPQNIADVSQAIARWIELQSYNDSSASTGWDSGRLLETAARNVHFKWIYGVRADADERTRHLLTEVVGPAVIGQTVAVPVLKGVADFSSELAEAIKRALTDTFKPGQPSTTKKP